jgi:hypothetical protein
MAIRVTYPTVKGYNTRCDAWVILYKLLGTEGRWRFSFRPKSKRNVYQLSLLSGKHGSWRDRQPD